MPAEVRMRAYEAVLGYFPPERVLRPWSRPCATPGPARPCCMPWSARTTAAPISSSAATAGVGSYYGTFEAQELTASLPAEDLGITRCGSTTPSTAGAAWPWPPAGPARIPTATTSPSPVPRCGPRAAGQPPPPSSPGRGRRAADRGPARIPPPTKGTPSHDQRHRLRAGSPACPCGQVDRGRQARSRTGRARPPGRAVRRDEVRPTSARASASAARTRHQHRPHRVRRRQAVQARVAVLVAAISPYREARDRVRTQVDNFVEVYVAAPLSTCAERDVKGLYAKALAGEIKNFTACPTPTSRRPTPRSSSTPRPRASTTRSTR